MAALALRYTDLGAMALSPAARHAGRAQAGAGEGQRCGAELQPAVAPSCRRCSWATWQRLAG
jgi:hypothetical protein